MGIQYIPRNMHTVFALLCFVVVIHWLIFPYPSGLLHWHCGNLTIAPMPAKQPWWIWINTSCEFIMNDCITTTKQSTTKPCAYFLGYTVVCHMCQIYFYFIRWTSKILVLIEQLIQHSPESEILHVPTLMFLTLNLTFWSKTKQILFTGSQGHISEVLQYKVFCAKSYLRRKIN